VPQDDLDRRGAYRGQAAGAEAAHAADARAACVEALMALIVTVRADGTTVLADDAASDRKIAGGQLVTTRGPG
jgi:hypothetical protein